MRNQHLSSRSQGYTVLTVVACLLFIANGLLAQSVPALINYQGRLTDAASVPLPPGVYSVAFRLWDKPSLDPAQQLIWGQEYDVAIVEGGAFNVILGAPGGRALTDNPAPAFSSLGVAFGQSNRFLGLTIARGTNGQPIQNPAELVPRQQIFSAPFALMAQTAALATRVPDGAITASNLQSAIISTDKIQDGSITLLKLLPRVVGTNVPAGGVAISSSSGVFATNLTTTTNLTDVPNLVVTIVTTGRPVYVGLISDGMLSTSGSSGSAGTISVVGPTSYGGGEAECIFTRGTNAISSERLIVSQGQAVNLGIYLPCSAINHVDLAPPGTNTYRFKIRSLNGHTVTIYRSKLIAYEL